MKVTNITNSGDISREVRLPLLKKGGGNSNVTLNPGEFIYIEERGNNSQLRMFEHKKLLSVTDDAKPEGFEFYKVYNNIDLLVLAGEELRKSHESLREAVINDESLPESFRKEFAGIKNEVLENLDELDASENTIEIEVIVPEDSLKNKGGRPKGSTNKSKRGRPKKKGTPGRPKKRGPKSKKKN